MFLEFNKFLANGSGRDVISVNSRGSCSHNFVISHLLINAAKKNQNVHLICCGESAQFYSLVCQRAGLPFRQLVEKGTIVTTCLVTRWQNAAASGHKLTVPHLEIDDDQRLVIIDDLLPLLDFSSNSDVMCLVHRLKTRVKSMLAVGVRTDDVEGEQLSRLLKSMSTMWVDVYPLSTGYSKDVHGVMELYHIKPFDGSCQQKMHFKVTERGAKLLVIGSHIAIT